MLRYFPKNIEKSLNSVKGKENRNIIKISHCIGKLAKYQSCSKIGDFETYFNNKL